MNWTTGDFIVAGVMLAILAGAGFYLLGGRGALTYRLACAITIVSALLLFWVTGAVGIIGAESEDANMLYIGAIALMLLGAIILRFRAASMAWLTFAMAGAVALIGAGALIAGLGSSDPSWPVDIIGATAFFALAFAAAGGLYRYSSGRAALQR